MKFCILSSGSEKNCFYIESGSSSILIDMGISLKALLDHLSILNIDFPAIKALFITHEHTDHIRGLRTFVKSADKPVFINSQSRLFLDFNMTAFKELLHDNPVKIGGMIVTPVRLSHDAANTFGFRIADDSADIFLASDIGKFDEVTISYARGCSAIAIESNHDREMLRKSYYPEKLKKRISGGSGHLSNDQAAEFIELTASDRTKNVFFLHISENNNSPVIINEIIKNRLGRKFPNIAFHISDRDSPSRLIEI